MRSPSAVASATSPVSDVGSVPAPEPAIRRIWPSTVVVVGLGLSVVWSCVLAYGLFYLIRIVL